ncbi:MAG: glycosyltransferase family 2 protein [Planctomycetota bacterium]|nr:glycosyltransferase family 2 protein [Planctomycetota bacterium]
MDLSIVVVNYRSWEPLERCLASIERTRSASPHRVEAVVVDNASGDGRIDAVAAAHPNVRFLTSASNDGFGCANDRGAAVTTGRRLLFLNPDAELPDGALDAWLAHFDALPAPAIAGCRQVGATGAERKVHDVFPGPWDSIPGVKAARRPPAGPCDRPFRVDWVTGAALLLERSTYEALGGWGDEYWLYFEDVDLCRRAHDGGAGVWVVPEVTIRHDHGGATRRDARTEAIAKSEVVRSRHIYLSRWVPGAPCLAGHTVTALRRVLEAFLGTLLDLCTLHLARSLRAQPRLLFELKRMYLRRLFRGTWRSPRLPDRRTIRSSDSDRLLR